MRIITLWQPWASLIALGLKNFETRSWPTSYRGPLLIHAAKRPMDYAEASVWDEAIALAKEAGHHLPPEKVPFPKQLPYGAVVAVTQMSECLEMIADLSKPPSVAANIYLQTALELAVGSWESGRYAWQLDSIQPLATPIPWRGGQGLRSAPNELQQQVRAQLGQPPAISPAPAGLGKDSSRVQLPLWN